MGENASKLMAHMAAGSGFAVPYADIREAQVAAMN